MILSFSQSPFSDATNVPKNWKEWRQIWLDSCFVFYIFDTNVHFPTFTVEKGRLQEFCHGCRVENGLAWTLADLAKSGARRGSRATWGRCKKKIHRELRKQERAIEGAVSWQIFSLWLKVKVELKQAHLKHSQWETRLPGISRPQRDGWMSFLSVVRQKHFCLGSAAD